MAKNLNISGVGGWLGFLVIALMILGPLLGFSTLTEVFRGAVDQFPQLAFSMQWQKYEQASWLIYVASAAISFSAGYRLWKNHSPESVKFAILAIWLAGPLGNVLYMVAAIIISGSNAGGNTIANMIGGTISTVIAAGIWTAYLMRSERVKNTYQLVRSS